jgi:hypothetical protein
MLGTFRRWLILGGAAFALVGGAALLLLTYKGAGGQREVYVYADSAWVAKAVEAAKDVHALPNARCEVDLQAVAETVAAVFGGAMTESLPRDRSFFDIVSVCGLKQSTFYYLPATLEVWVNYCDLRVSSACLAIKVFAFTHPFGAADWPCVREVMRQELVNYDQTRVRRILPVNCQSAYAPARAFAESNRSA